MNAVFADEDLQRLFVQDHVHPGFSPAVAKGFRKAVLAIIAASDERDLYALRGLRFEKLKGSRQHQHSLRINDQYRLIVEIEGADQEKRVRIVEVTDYH